MARITTPATTESGRPETLPPFLTALLIVAAVIQAFGHINSGLEQRIGIDFYQYWGVGQAIRLSGGCPLALWRRFCSRLSYSR